MKLKRGLILLIVGAGISGASFGFLSIIEQYENSLMSDDWWSVSLGKGDTFSRTFNSADIDNEILFYVDYEPETANLVLFVVDKNNYIVFEEEIFRNHLLKNSFKPIKGAIYDVKVSNTGPRNVDVWDVGYEESLAVVDGSYVVPTERDYNITLALLFIFGILICIIGTIVLFHDRRKNNNSSSSNNENLRGRQPVSILFQILLCVVIPILSVYAFYRINKLGPGILVLAGAFSSFAVQYVMPFQYGIGLTVALFYGVILFFIIKWSKDWNRKISQVQS